jgi:hypothetical protein
LAVGFCALAIPLRRKGTGMRRLCRSSKMRVQNRQSSNGAAAAGTITIFISLKKIEEFRI